MSEPAAAGEEEVLEFGARRRRPGIALALGCTVLLAGVLAGALLVTSGSSARRPGTLPTASPLPQVAITFDAPTPVANGLPIRGTRCPAGAHCSVWNRLPGAAVAAIRAAFPGAEVNSQTPSSPTVQVTTTPIYLLGTSSPGAAPCAS